MSERTIPIKSFFENQTCLVVEASKSFQASIHLCLKALDIPSTSIIFISKFDEAVRRIEELKPRILITEYDVDGRKGLALVELQQRHHEDQLRLSIVISRSSSDSVVAEAAEEQVDGFLVKPFSTEDFRKKFQACVESKVNPSAYSLKIRQGRKAMADKSYEVAENLFKDSKKLHEKPSLACFYLGDTYRLQSDNLAALNEFKEGRRYSPLHYKCLIGEFEILVENKDYNQAHELIPILIKNFPLTPRRLTQVFIAAVFSFKFEYLPHYYEQLLRMEQRSPELVKIASVALYTGGKWYLQKNEFKQAADLFEKALVVVGREYSFLEKIINELVSAVAKQEACRFFSKVLSADTGSPAYSRLAFKVDQLVLPRSALVDKARKLVFSGAADAETYKTIVKLFVDEGKVALAETVISRAISTHPELRDVLYKLLEESLPDPARKI